MEPREGKGVQGGREGRDNAGCSKDRLHTHTQTPNQGSAVPYRLNEVVLVRRRNAACKMWFEGDIERVRRKGVNIEGWRV